jgi:hypothetical protein
MTVLREIEIGPFRRVFRPGGVRETGRSPGRTQRTWRM